MQPDVDSLPEQASTASLASDTTPEMQQLQLRLWRRMSPLEKAQALGQASRCVRDLSLAGIRKRHPSASDREHRLRYALLTLGRPLASQAYPELEAALAG